MYTFLKGIDSEGNRSVFHRMEKSTAKLQTERSIFFRCAGILFYRKAGYCLESLAAVVIEEDAIFGVFG